MPLGKLKTERMVPVDSFVCELVQRLRFFRSFDPLPPDGHLLARPHGKTALIRQLRYYLHEVRAAAGITTRIVPHQLRHTYASQMIRSSVTLPALMKLHDHADPEMTMRYVDVTSNDLQREYQMARALHRKVAIRRCHTTRFRRKSGNLRFASVLINTDFCHGLLVLLGHKD